MSILSSSAPKRCSRAKLTRSPRSKPIPARCTGNQPEAPTANSRNHSIMSLLDQLGGVLSKMAGGNLNEQETHQQYDQLANQVPQNQLGAAIGPALASLGSGEVQQRVTDSAAQMNPEQRGSVMQTLLGGLGSSGNLGGILSQLGISPSVQNDPQSATPDEVGKLAAHAQTNAPDVFHQAMSFYSAHPTLVKALGTAVLAGIAHHISKS